MGGKDYWSVTRVKYRLRILWSVRCSDTGGANDYVYTFIVYFRAHSLWTHVHAMFVCWLLGCVWLLFFARFFVLKISDIFCSETIRFVIPLKTNMDPKKRLVSNQNLIFPSIVCQLPAVPFVLRGIGQFEVVSFDRSREDESKSGGARDQIYRRLGRIFQWISNHSIVVVGCEKHHLANSHLYCLLLRVQYL